MSERVTFSSKNGSQVTGVISFPKGEGRPPGLVLVQEWWGLNGHIQSLVDRFAAEGFVTLAPDLYHGKVTSDPAEAGAMMQALDGARALADIDGAVQFLRQNGRVNGKIGVTGFCMGGAYTFVAATRIPEVGAAVAFYGIPPAGRADYKNAKAPLMAHFAKRDEWAKVEHAEAIKREIEASGHTMILHTYDADHAFMNDTRPEVYSAESAKLAWQRTVEFFHQHLG